MTPINLQVCIPYQKCPFKCPMCIADHAPQFKNLYKENEAGYFNLLKHALKQNPIKTIVLTGDTEPSLDVEWMNKVIWFVKANFPHITIELQTHVYKDHYLNSPMLDRICYSLTTVNDIYMLTHVFPNYQPTRVRAVILATEENIDFLYKHRKDLEFNLDWCDQITFKLLQYTAYDQADKDTYITEHRLTADDKRLQKLVLQYSTTSFNRSVVVDTNCQDAKGRYKIFREDGNVYSAWDKLKPEYLEY